MDMMAVLIEFILKLWLGKLRVYLWLYLGSLLAGVAVIVPDVNFGGATVLILAYANWLLYAIFRADTALTTNNYYRILNIPRDYVTGVKQLLILILFVPQLFIIQRAYAIDIFFLTFDLLVLFYLFFKLERWNMHVVAKFLMTITWPVLVIGLTVTLALLLTTYTHIVMLALLAGLFFFELKQWLNGKYNRI
jgi:hypothetical protein